MPYGSLKPGLDNNKNLLRKKKLFKKERTFLELKKEYLNASYGKIDYKKASKEELLAIRKRVIQQRKKSERTQIMMYLTLVCIIVFGAFSFYKYDEKRETERIHHQKTNSPKQKNNFVWLVKDGDKWLEKGHLKNAIFEYKKALKISKMSYEVNYKLLNAYSLHCQNKLEYCNEAEILLKELLLNFPEKEAELALIKERLAIDFSK